MASTTTNLGLMKPAYSDDADISDINGNMDLIDAEAGRVRANVAANYDSSETYAVGDYCLHDGSLYKCSTAISSPEAWTAGHWTQIKITGELSMLNGKITTLDNNKTNRVEINVNTYAYNSKDAYINILNNLSNYYTGTVYARLSNGINAMCLVIKANNYASILAIFDDYYAPMVYRKTNNNDALNGIAIT